MRKTLLVLAALVCLVEAVALARPRTTPVSLVAFHPSPPRRASRPDTALRGLSLTPTGSRLLAELTADDVARGLWGLSRLPPAEGGLAPSQVLELAPLVERGRGLRAQRSGLRTERSDLRDRIRHRSSRLALVLGPQRLAHAVQHSEPMGLDHLGRRP